MPTHWDAESDYESQGYARLHRTMEDAVRRPEGQRYFCELSRGLWPTAPLTPPLAERRVRSTLSPHRLCFRLPANAARLICLSLDGVELSCRSTALQVMSRRPSNSGRPVLYEE